MFERRINGKFRTKKVQFIKVDEPRKKPSASLEADQARLHSAMCHRAMFTEHSDRANVTDVRRLKTPKGDIFRADVDYVNENGTRVRYTLNCVIGATNMVDYPMREVI